MTTPEHLTALGLFADAGRPASRFEVFGSVPLAKHVECIDFLLAGDLLERTAESDRFGATRMRVTANGLKALGRAAPSAGMRDVRLTAGRVRR